MAAVPRASKEIPPPKPTPTEVREKATLFLLCLRIGGIEGDVERRRVALPVRRQCERQLIAAALVDPVLGVPQVARSLLGINTLRLDLVGEGVVEVQLGGELVALL